MGSDGERVMEPQVRYVRTEDGVNVAYYTLGSGPPFLWLSFPSTHLLEEWRMPAMRRALEGAAQVFTLIRMDPRGFGLSDRDAPNISFAGIADDIRTVMETVTQEPAIILGMALANFSSMVYAADYPESVSRLVLLSPARSIRDARGPRLDALYELARVDWKFASETIARSFWDMPPEQQEQMGRLLRESVDPQTLTDLMNITEAAFDATELLGRLSMPTLVLHDRSNQNITTAEGARRVAGLIPDARFVELDSAWHTARAVIRFLAETGAAPPRPAPTAPVTAPADAADTGTQTGMTQTGTAVILFADIVDSTALTERLGDAAFREKARELGSSLRVTIRDCGGTPVEGPTLGDGILATFASARQAIEGALACARAGDDAGLPLHLGLHAGDVSREKDPDGRDNVYGGAVNVASRISGLSAPGEVLVSDIVRGLARTSAGVSFADRGEQALKGVGEPVRVWAVMEGG
jgi:class 3 adenylate cyclase/pimeloyl-ACP methyl ester carboxylesterase